MSIKLLPVNTIKANLGIEPNGKVQNFFTYTCYRYMDKYVPMDKGSLRTIVDLQNDSITYMSPYASYQYYGMRADGTHVINPENYTTPGTGPYWDQLMISADFDNVIDEVRQMMKG